MVPNLFRERVELGREGPLLVISLLVVIVRKGWTELIQAQRQLVVVVHQIVARSSLV